MKLNLRHCRVYLAALWVADQERYEDDGTNKKKKEGRREGGRKEEVFNQQQKSQCLTVHTAFY